MKANVVFKHHTYPRAVLRVGASDYFVVMSDHYVDIAHADDIRGNLTLVDVKWLLNLTRGTLVNIKVLGRYVTLAGAMQASSTFASRERCNTDDDFET